MSNSHNSGNIPTPELVSKTYGSTKIPVHEVCFVWAIENYTLHQKNMKMISSPLFGCDIDNGNKWYLMLNPNGSDGMIDLALELSVNNLDEKCFAKYVVSILDGKLRAAYRKFHDFYEYNKSTTSASKPLIMRTELYTERSSTLLPNDTLTIMCEIIYSSMNTSEVISHQMKSLQQSSNVGENKIVQDFEAILKNQLFTDVVLIANGKDYPAHKAVLSARSPVFAAMFASNMEEVENSRVKIKDIDEEVLENMLSYVYTGRCENIKSVDKLLVVAEKYDLQLLKNICEDELIENLSLDNALEILPFADMNCASVLKSETINFIVVHFTDLMNTEAWKNFGQSNYRLLKEICEALSARSNRILCKYLQTT